MTKKTEKTAPAEKREEKKKRGLLGRVVTLALVLCVVLAAAAMTAMEDGGRMASLRRWLIYGGSGGAKDVYTYAADSANRYGKLGKNLLVVNPNTAQLISDDGSVLYDLPLRMTNPQLSVGRKYAAVCDVGGSTVYILDENGISRTLHTERGLQYFSARLNREDYLAVTEQKAGYKTSVSVYNGEGTLVFSFDSHDNYLSDAVGTDDCRRLVVVTLDVHEGAFASRVRMYGLHSDSSQPASESVIRDGLVMDFRCTGNRVVSLCDKRLTIASLEGETLLDRAYGNLHLHDYALDGDGFCALLLGRYQAGNICTLETYDMDGQELASLELTEEVLDIAAGGDYLAVLYGQGMVIYRKDLTEVSRLTDTDYAGQLQVEADGTVLLISGSYAWRFLP